MYTGFEGRGLFRVFRKQHIYSSRGASLVELCLVIGLLIGAVLTVVQFAAPFQGDQIALKAEEILAAYQAEANKTYRVGAINEEGVYISRDVNDQKAVLEALAGRIHAATDVSDFCAQTLYWDGQAGSWSLPDVGAPGYVAFDETGSSDCNDVLPGVVMQAFNAANHSNLGRIEYGVAVFNVDYPNLYALYRAEFQTE